MGARARRRRARPSEDQGGHAPLKPRGKDGLPLLRQRPGRRGELPVEELKGPLPRGDLRVRCLRRPPPIGIPRRGPAGAATPRRSSSPGTTATPTSPTTSSTCPPRRAVVVGNGNVALDVAQMLRAATRRRSCRPTSPTTRWRRSRAGSIEEVVVLGRRGPAQAAFTTPELIELSELAAADVIVDPGDMQLDPGERADRRGGRRADEEEDRGAARLRGERAARPRSQRIVLRFFASLLEIVGSEHVEGVRVGRTELVERRRGPSARGRHARRRRRSPASSCSAPSATAACRCRACRSTSAPRRSPTTHRRVLEAAGGAPPSRRVRLRLDQAWPGRGSSARTRRTARTRSTICSPTPPPAASPSPPSATPTRS